MSCRDENAWIYRQARLQLSEAHQAERECHPCPIFEHIGPWTTYSIPSAQTKPPITPILTFPLITSTNQPPRPRQANPSTHIAHLITSSITRTDGVKSALLRTNTIGHKRGRNKHQQHAQALSSHIYLVLTVHSRNVLLLPIRPNIGERTVLQKRAKKSLTSKQALLAFDAALRCRFVCLTPPPAIDLTCVVPTLPCQRVYVGDPWSIKSYLIHNVS
jgi:hypothetical protein